MVSDLSIIKGLPPAGCLSTFVTDFDFSVDTDASMYRNAQLLYLIEDTKISHTLANSKLHGFFKQSS